MTSLMMQNKTIDLSKLKTKVSIQLNHLIKLSQKKVEKVLVEVVKWEVKQAEKLEVKREKAKIIYRTITKEVDKVVERPVYRNTCLDADGLRLARCAIRGQSPDTCKPDKPLPGAPLALRWDWSLGSALDYRLGGPLP